MPALNVTFDIPWICGIIFYKYAKALQNNYFEQAGIDKRIKSFYNFFQGHAPKFTQPLQPRSSNEFPVHTEQTTATPEIKNTTVTPNVTKGMQI